MALILDAVDGVMSDLQGLRSEVRQFLKAEIASGGFIPEADAWMSGASPLFSQRLAKRGWVGMTVPVEYGGHGRSALERYVVTEELLAYGAPVAAHWIADRQMAPGILRNGTEAQKRAYVPGIVSAQKFFAIGMSEPDSGSDLASVRTKATEVDGGWRISGTKVWTSIAHLATNMVVLARSDSSRSRHEGLSQFIVDLPHPDVHINPIITIDGAHHFNEVVFDDAVVPASALLGRRGEGWRQVTDELANERSGPERILSSLPVLRAWKSYLDRGDGCTQPEELGELLSRLLLLRQMSLAVADRVLAGANPATEAALVKDLGTTFEGEVVDAVRRYAEIETDPDGEGLSALLGKAILHTPAFTLRGGTNEILRSIIAKGVMV